LVPPNPMSYDYSEAVAWMGDESMEWEGDRSAPHEDR